jgi:hypothetical protein
VTHLLVPPPSMQVANDVAVPVARRDLSPDERAEMFALIESHFEGVREDVFHRDLDAKDWVLRIVRDEALVGFSTLQSYRAMADGRCLNVIYSGDTVVSPEAWGSPVLARGWIALVRALQASHPNEPWYWLLLSSGFRTYRFLPVFWREFWPRHDAETPSNVRALMEELARDHFGDAYDPTAGVVRFETPQRLRAHLAAVPEGKGNDSHVRFFLERNPGHAEGDELVCLTELGDANLTAAGVRMVRGSSR